MNTFFFSLQKSRIFHRPYCICLPICTQIWLFPSNFQDAFLINYNNGKLMTIYDSNNSGKIHLFKAICQYLQIDNIVILIPSFFIPLIFNMLLLIALLSNCFPSSAKNLLRPAFIMTISRLWFLFKNLFENIYPKFKMYIFIYASNCAFSFLVSRHSSPLIRSVVKSGHNQKEDKTGTQCNTMIFI